MIEHALRQLAHHVGNPLNGFGGAELLADSAEASNVAEEDAYIRVTPFEQFGMIDHAGGEALAERLLHVKPGAECGLLLFDARQAGCHAAGEHFDEHRFELRNRLLRLPADLPAFAVERANDLPLAIEDRSGDDGFDTARRGANLG